MPKPKTTEATARPWIVNPDTNSVSCGCKEFEPMIAEMYDSDYTTEVERAANAALIVRAVNSHAALMEAITDLIPWVSKAGGDHAFENCAVPNGWSNAIHNARAALQAAGKEGK